MKKIVKMSLVVACVYAFNPMSILSAKEYETNDTNEVELTVEAMFESYDENEKVLVTSDGEFLQGKMTVCAEDGVTVLKEYNSSTDLNAITVDKAKEIAKKSLFISDFDKLSISTRGTSVPTQTRYLDLGSQNAYTSQGFSGAGWRTGGFKFKPKVGTGNYLVYGSYGDSGNAGTATNFINTLNGNNTGVALPKNTRKYVLSADWTFYYTFNPIANSYYIVANIEL